MQRRIGRPVNCESIGLNRCPTSRLLTAAQASCLSRAVTAAEPRPASPRPSRRLGLTSRPVSPSTCQLLRPRQFIMKHIKENWLMAAPHAPRRRPVPPQPRRGLLYLETSTRVIIFSFYLTNHNKLKVQHAGRPLRSVGRHAGRTV